MLSDSGLEQWTNSWHCVLEQILGIAPRKGSSLLLHVMLGLR